MLELSRKIIYLNGSYHRVLYGEQLYDEWKDMPMDYVLRNLDRLDRIRRGETLPEAD